MDVNIFIYNDNGLWGGFAVDLMEGIQYFSDEKQKVKNYLINEINNRLLFLEINLKPKINEHVLPDLV